MVRYVKEKGWPRYWTCAGCGRKAPRIKNVLHLEKCPIRIIEKKEG